MIENSFIKKLNLINRNPIYLITALNKEQTKCYFFIQCSGNILNGLKNSKEQLVDLNNPYITIILSGFGDIPTEQDWNYMASTYNFHPPK